MTAVPRSRGEVMQSFLADLKQFALGFSKNTFYRSLAYGVIFSAIITLIIGAIVDVFALDAKFPYFLVKEQAYWLE
jgi:hypothetical protein